MKTWIFCFGIMLLSVCKVQAQNDPVLAGMIYAYTDKAEKELKNQEKVMLMQTTGHIWFKEEVERNHQSATRVQQLFGLVPFHRGVCCTGIWLLSRDRPTGG